MCLEVIQIKYIDSQRTSCENMSENSFDEEFKEIIHNLNTVMSLL